MLKRLILLLAIVAFMYACDGSAKKTESAYSVLTLLPEAENLVGKEVELQGKVKHVCSHTGKRCFIEAVNSPETILVTAAGDFETFDPEIIGKEVKVKGILREQKITEDQIQSKEDAVKEKLENAEDEEEKEHCDTEQNNIENMRKWMKDHNKDYYATYIIEGTKYEVVK